MNPRLLIVFFTISLYSQLCIAQSIKFDAFVPAIGEISKSEIISAAVNSLGEVYLCDLEGAQVRVFNQDGGLKNQLKSINVSGIEIALKSPVLVNVDFKDRLIVYDDVLYKIFVQDPNGANFSFGEKGGSRGRIDKITEIASDKEGYIYVLHKDRKEIDVYDPRGRYLTWIGPSNVGFTTPVSITVNGNNELCVLDAEDATVIMYDNTGKITNTCRSLAKKVGIKLTKPTNITAGNNPDFFIMDAETGSIIHFTRLGDLRGQIGSKGPSMAGVMIAPSIVIAGKGIKNHLVVVDNPGKRHQKFSYSTDIEKPFSFQKRYKVNPLKTSRKDIALYASSKNKNRYIIEEKNKENVIAYHDTSSKANLIIKTKVSQPSDLVVDGEGNILVADRKGNEISVFDSTGIFLKKLNSDIPEKIKELSSLAIQSDGSILVLDQASANLHRYAKNGVYDKLLLTRSKTALLSPRAVRVDSKDNIYIWDDKLNAILKVSPSGWPIAVRQLKVRSDKSEKEGSIADFYIDPLDHLCILNASTYQFEMWQWTEEPELKFSFGRDESDALGLANIARIHFDNAQFILYATTSKGITKAFQLSLQPPKPKGTYFFDANSNGLIVEIEKDASNAVIGHALMTNGVLKNDSIAARTNDSRLLLNTDKSKYPVLRNYRLVSISPTDVSEPAEGFDDYYTYGTRLLEIGKYESGFEALQQAGQKMRCSEGMKMQMGQKLAESCVVMAKRGDVAKSLPMIRYAYELSPGNADVQLAYSSVYSSYFMQLADRNEFGSIITETERLLGNSNTKEILLRAVDSLSISLANLPNEKAINNAILLQKKLIEWDENNPKYYGSLSYSHFNMFKFKKNTGVPEFELISVLKEADKNGQIAVSGLKKKQQPHFEVQLLHLQVMNALGKYEDVEKTVQQELASNSFAMNNSITAQYRECLADAFENQNKYDEAALEYKRILDNDASNSKIKEMLGNAYIRSNKLDEARTIYLELLAADRFNASYTAQLGRIELIRKNFVEASFQLEKAIKLDPSERSYYGPLGESFEGANNLQKALDSYKTAVPYEEAKYTAAKNKFISEKVIQEQLATLKKYLMSVARLSEQLGKFDEAISFYKKLIQVDMSNAEAYYGLGRCNLNAGFIYDAANAFYSACRIEPANETYTAAYSNALKMRDKLSDNAQPIDILEVRVPDIYPSLYRNYSDIKLLPVGEIIVANNSSSPITPQAITIQVAGLMDTPTSISPSVLVGYSNSSIPISAIFNESILTYIVDEKKQLEVEITYKVGNATKSSKKVVPFTLKGRNSISWNDKRRLAAFVASNVESFIDLNRQLDQVFAEEQTYGINKNLLKAIQLYATLQLNKIIYSPDPTLNFATVSTNTDIQDFLQYPAETMKRKSGDCDDLVALFCSLLENSGISTAYIDVPGHVFLAFDSRLRPEELVKAGLTASDVIIENNTVWIPLETTMIGNEEFMTAWKTGAERYYNELIQGNFPEVVSLFEARSVYVPSSYVPQGFTAELPSKESLLVKYNNQISKLLVKIKKGVITELENRYVAEPNNVFVKNKYGTLLAQTGDLEAAQKVYLEALELSPNNSVTLNNLGNLYYLKGDGAKALEYYQQAASLDSEDAEIQINICKSYLISGNKAEAKKSFGKALEINPKLANSYLTLQSQLK
jgi:tetratricopeptide (TPR) repeat protein/DNA-binding beta-propeller fold protein YncE